VFVFVFVAVSATNILTVKFCSDDLLTNCLLFAIVLLLFSFGFGFSFSFCVCHSAQFAYHCWPRQDSEGGKCVPSAVAINPVNNKKKKTTTTKRDVHNYTTTTTNTPAQQ